MDSSNKVFLTLKDLYVFSKLERLVAAFCMGIPFFLILADMQSALSFVRIAWGIGVIMLIPLVVSVAAYQINQMSTGKGVITFLGTMVFVGALFYSWSWVLPQPTTIRDSISDYVAMDNSQTFGMLLTIASMLFIFNGAVYANKSNLAESKKHGRWYNIVLGLLLLGVVLFPCTNERLKILHYVSAISFFAGSGVVISFLNDRHHRKLSFFITGVMAAGFLLWALHVSFVSLFWAETIGLWVIGIHYILASLNEL